MPTAAVHGTAANACAGVEAHPNVRRTSGLVEEIVTRACALADGDVRPASARKLDWLDRCDARARQLAVGSPALAHAAALEFLGEAIAAATTAGTLEDGAAREAVGHVARHLDASASDVALAVYRRVVAAHGIGQLTPSAAVDVVLGLLVELGAVDGVSLWAEQRCLASAGRGARSRRLHEVARTVLDGEPTAPSPVVVVERWDEPYAALVARSCTDSAFLDEAALALSALLERDALYARGVERERRIVAAGERRLMRLGFDLHDGPLQELVALAEDVRVARGHIEPLLDEGDGARARGCFDDLAARLEVLDRELRHIAHSVRSNTALDRPLQSALKREVEALRRAGVQTELIVKGDVSGLTNSQKIVVYRVVQEALNNVRKHSRATSAHVRVRTTNRFIQVVVADDGRGLGGRRRAAADRLGLAGVCERVHLLGGTVSIGSGPTGGTRVCATVPHWRASTDAPEPTYAASA